MRLTGRLQAISVALLLMGLGGGSGVHAQDVPLAARDKPGALTEQRQALQQTVADEQAAVVLEREELQRRETALPGLLQDLQTRAADDALLDQARADVETARLRQTDAQTAIESTAAAIEKLEERIREQETREQLLRNPARQDELAGADRAAQLQQTRAELAEQRVALQLEQQRLENLRHRLDLAGQRLALAERWLAGVTDAYQRQRARRLEEDQQDESTRLQQQLERYLEQADALRRRLERTGRNLSATHQRRLAAELRAADERAQLTQWDINLFATQSALNHLGILAEQAGADREALRQGQRQLASLRNELARQAEAVNDKLSRAGRQQQALREQRAVASGDELRRLDEVGAWMDGFLVELGTRRDNVQTQRAHLENVSQRLSQRYGEALSADLLHRKTPPADAAAWRQLVTDLGEAPRVLFYQTRLSLESAYRAISQDTDPWRWAGFLALGLGFAALLTVARCGLRRTLQRLDAQQEVSYAGYLIHGSAELLRKNYPTVGLVMAVLLAVWIFEVPQPGRGIITTIALLVLGSKAAVDLAGWLLIAPRLPSERRDPALYRRWVITLLAGGVLATLTLLAHLSAVTETVIGFFDWLCMVYLSLVNGPLLRARRYYIEQLAPHYGGRHWFMGLRLVTLALPISLLGAALVGVVGYIDLAWSIAWHLGVFSLIVSGWWILRGLLNDLAVLLKNIAVSRSRNGLLWTQEIIRPVHLLLRIVLLTGAAWVLSLLYGWTDVYLQVLVDWRPVLLAMGGALLAGVGIFIGASLYVAQTDSTPGNALIRHTRQPLTLLLPAAAALLALPDPLLEQAAAAAIRHGLVLVIITVLAWGVVRLVSALEEVVEQRYRVDAKDNYGARRVQTQVRILRRIVVVVVYLIAASAMLMTFPTIRQLGAGLLASAGVAGLVAGVAARPFLENLIAGIQIGLTQPIRLDDVVIVEGEWGKIAEINATYVVVRIWDERRLVVPLNYFNTQPFQNWTRSSSELLGTAFFYVDYTFPVEKGRTELKRILDASNLWDGRAWGLQVTNTSAQTLELRALMSAADASTTWDLRCYVREKFIAFLQRDYPDALPRTRTVWEQGTPVPRTAHTPRADTPRLDPAS
jgi:potassium efflux system protein